MPALYAGYFFSRSAIAALLGLCAAAYAGTIAAIGLDPALGFTRWVVTMSVVAGAAGALHTLRCTSTAWSARSTHRPHGSAHRRAQPPRLQRGIRARGRARGPHLRAVRVLLGDIDHFKALNDAHGHIPGDEALAAVGETLRDGCRTIDTAARIGGEEFALLLPGTGSDEGFEAAERLREAVATLRGPPASR